jgi:hypothetical protein
MKTAAIMLLALLGTALTGCGSAWGSTTGRAQRAECPCRRHLDGHDDGRGQPLSNHVDAGPDRD